MIWIDQNNNETGSTHNPGTTTTTSSRSAGTANSNHNHNNHNEAPAGTVLRFVFTLALLCMEEDEAADGGFPSLLHPPHHGSTSNNNHSHNDDDDNFICTSESRFAYSYWQLGLQQHRQRLQETNPTGGHNTPVLLQPISRLFPTVQSPGVVDLSFDYDEATAADHDILVLTITHEDTGATIQIDVGHLLQQQQNVKVGILGNGSGTASTRPRRKPAAATDLFQEEEDENNSDDEGIALNEEEEDEEDHPTRRHRAMPFVYDAMDRSSDEENEFDVDHDEEDDDDGFLVDDDDDEIHDDECHICKDGGDLMVCDGGRHMDGCGRSYHGPCVGRSTIPQGDWVCSECARSGGIHVDGNKGHEFVKKKKRVVGLVLEDSSSSSSDEEKEGTRSAEEEKGHPNKRRQVLVDSDEDEYGYSYG